MGKFAVCRCQRCGELIGYLGRVWQFLNIGHECQNRELRLVPYGPDADSLIAKGWQIAPEEDGNRIMFHVYLEKFEEPKP